MSYIATTVEIIEEARAGRPFILVDAEDRENEGDVIVPAQFATPEMIAFMAIQARGLICLAITVQRASKLQLAPMAGVNKSGFGTAFTTSIEARSGVTTGISAADRSRTIQVAADPATGPDDITSPGHVFPLVARDGGVLVRAGHTEAAVDVARLAGLMPAGVICEVMSEDGSMAKLTELVEFAHRHGLKIGTIADLIAYRRKTETLVERVADAPFDSVHGAGFRIIVYRNRIDGSEHVALVRGKPGDDTPTLVRVHQIDLTADILGWSAAHRDYVPRAIKALASYTGPAAAVFVRDANPSSISERIGGGRGHYQRTMAERDYGIGAQILRDLGVTEMILLTSSTAKLGAIEGFGLHVQSRRPVPRIVQCPDEPCG